MILVIIIMTGNQGWFDAEYMARWMVSDLDVRLIRESILLSKSKLSGWQAVSCSPGDIIDMR